MIKMRRSLAWEYVSFKTGINIEPLKRYFGKEIFIIDITRLVCL